MPTIDSKHTTRRAIHLKDSVAVARRAIKKGAETMNVPARHLFSPP